MRPSLQLVENKMKLSVSNIVWGEENLVDFFRLLKKENCDGVEIAPSLIWKEPILSNKDERKLLKKQIFESGLEFVGFHSLLYKRPDLQIFKVETRRKTIDYIKELVSLCSELGGKQLIFGSPKNRSLNGQSYEKCLLQTVEDFHEIAEHGMNKKVYFCIEPLGKNYTDFMISVEEGGKLVRRINHPYFKLHLDTKTLFYTKEHTNGAIESFGDLIQHVHVSDDDLNQPGTINKDHKIISNYLKKIDYNKYLSIEMKKNSLKSLKNGIKFVKNTYISQ